MISQSGNVGINLTLQQRGLPIAYMITVGNQAGSGIEDCLEAFIRDERVTAVGMFIEAIRDPQRFALLARKAFQRNLRIVALQTGKSDAGALIASSHTASLAGQRSAYAALFDRCGVATVDTPVELIETLKLLNFGGPLSGVRMASLSCSGGEASLVADLAESTTLKFESFPDEHRVRIESTLTELVTVGNPFDYHTFMWNDRAAMRSTFSQVMQGDHDATILVLDAPPRDDQDSSSWLVATEAFADAAQATNRRGVVVATLPECLSEHMRTAITARGIVPLQGLYESLIALQCAAWLGTHSPGSPPLTVMRPGSTQVIDEAKSKQMLASWGINTPQGTRCTRNNLSAAASAIGFPVTLKGLGFAHKSEHGAVVVGIESQFTLQAALAAMPNHIDDFLVEQTVITIVAEMLVSIRRSPPIGWLITVGAGGIFTELWRDTRSLLAPTTRTEIAIAIGDLRIAPILRGYRGKPGANMEALIDCIMNLAEAVVETNIAEVELNPVLVTPTTAVAVDALIIQETP
jgi:acyl-CoA synthetase (NDP forming)